VGKPSPKIPRVIAPVALILVNPFGSTMQTKSPIDRAHQLWYIYTSPMTQSKLTNVLQLAMKGRTIYKLSTFQSGLSESIKGLYTSVKSVYTQPD
jgi:hypothetical protein